MDDYKTRKIESVSGLSGSSVIHINILSSTALSSIALYYALRTRFPSSPTKGFTASWLLLIFPLLLSMTLFANHPELLFLSFAAPAAALVYLKPRKERGVPLPSTLTSPTTLAPESPPWPRTWTSPASPLEPPTLEFPRPKVTVAQLNCVTTYRAHMLMMTILAILAVDFQVFPRSLAKCETFGVSLMDLGVGSFVFTQGLVSALPLIKDPRHLLLPLAPKVKTIVRKMVPVILLGLVRVVLVKGADYPVSTSTPLQFNGANANEWNRNTRRNTAFIGISSSLWLFYLFYKSYFTRSWRIARLLRLEWQSYFVSPQQPAPPRLRFAI
ncbi:Glucosaminyl phosphatidylinositol (GlcN-PI) nositol acylation protein [Marasmius sp. AFHP31]|nr:Glucosaminyl phosphatidylinositol (GlcN-PI) nositol acylation protein [Marasmius sp. AFHP31]